MFACNYDTVAPNKTPDHYSYACHHYDSDIFGTVFKIGRKLVSYVKHCINYSSIYHKDDADHCDYHGFYLGWSELDFVEPEIQQKSEDQS